MAANDVQIHDIEAPLPPGTNVVNTDQAESEVATSSAKPEPTGPLLPPVTVGASSSNPTSLHTQGQALRRSATEEEVNRKMCLSRGLLGLKAFHLSATIALGIICIWLSANKSHDDCGSKPLKMKDWFMGTGITNLVAAGIILCLLLALCSVMNKHMVRASVLKARGHDAAADREVSAGAAQTGTGACAVCCSVCGMLCLLLFYIIWGILGIVSVVSAGSDANKAQCPEHVYYWVIFVISFGMSCCCQCIDQCCTAGATAFAKLVAECPPIGC